jgi:hypothetical protein
VLHEVLGRGAMGQVFAGSIRQDGGPVAVKVLKPELVSDPEVVARFVQERAILMSVSHPNVVRVLDLVVEGETLAIVMELIPGPDLRRHLRDRGTVAPAVAVRLTGQLLDGMAAVHAAGIIHRDIKPENLLLDTSGDQLVVKLTDFGVARLSYGASLTKLSGVIGTPEYMAPELAEHETATPAVDVYSAGIVLYELLYGRTPFAGGHPLAVLRRHADQAPPPIPGLPAALWDQIARMLAKDPRSRPRSAAEAAAALAPLESALATHPPLPPWPGPTTPVPPPAAAGQAATEGPAEPAQHATVLRYRDRATPPGHDGPGRDGPGQPATPDTTAGASGPTRSRLRSRPAIALAAVLAAVLAVVAALVVPRLVGSKTARPAAAASYAFTPQRYRDGVLIARHWTLTGTNGSMLTETITASSTTGKAISAEFQDAIPSAVAPTLHSVHFSPPPAKIIRADPIVEWRLYLPAHGSITIGYHTTVPSDGATHTRLTRWATDQRTLQAHLPAPQTTTPTPQLTPTPTTPPTRAQTAPQPTAPIASSPAPNPAASDYASVSLSVNSPSVTARLYFGQLDAVVAALAGQVTFNTLPGDQANHPDTCVDTVVFSNVSGSTGTVGAVNLGSGWAAVETAPSTAVQGSGLNLHQQLTIPPDTASPGNSWNGYAVLNAATTATSGYYSLELQNENGSAQTWLVSGQQVACSSLSR